MAALFLCLVLRRSMHAHARTNEISVYYILFIIYYLRNKKQCKKVRRKEGKKEIIERDGMME